MWDLQYSQWNSDCCWNLSHEYCWFHCYSHKHSQITECCSPSPATLEVLFCFFRIWSFTPFTNHLDSNDNSKSVSSPLRENSDRPRSVTYWIWSWLGLLEKCCLSCDFTFWLSSNFRTQFSFPLVFSWDFWRRSRWHVCYSAQHFSSYQSNNFWIGRSWKFFLKDDCIRLSLMECQLFLNRKNDVDPVYGVLNLVHAFCR